MCAWSEQKRAAICMYERGRTTEICRHKRNLRESSAGLRSLGQFLSTVHAPCHLSLSLFLLSLAILDGSSAVPSLAARNSFRCKNFCMSTIPILEYLGLRHSLTMNPSNEAW